MSKEYQGGMKNGLYHGQGELTDHITGATYKCQFKKGLKDGKGILTIPEAFVYNGQFKKDAFHGYGSLKYADGSYYKGDFWNGQIEGKGIFYYRNGKIYDGEFINGKKDGKGIEFDTVKPEKHHGFLG